MHEMDCDEITAEIDDLAADARDAVVVMYNRARLLELDTW